MEHSFTENIKAILSDRFKENATSIYDESPLLQYINEKTRSANRGSKSRSSFANLYAIYVIIEDYLDKGFDKKGGYSKYEGALFNKLFARQRELPFGAKLQNHALNNRMNSEYQKYFPRSEFIPILRNMDTNRYWINENLLRIKVGKREFNIANAVIEIIDDYAKTKEDSFKRFINDLEKLHKIKKSNPKKAEQYILGLLAPNVDARLFEIVSYSILKFHYGDQSIIWGKDMSSLKKDHLILYKTGRTNANDGGIDFVMKPLGTFFQVTETLDFKKYFLDIDKIQKYPITFVIKSSESIIDLAKRIENNANKTYSIKAIVKKYMACIEEIINISRLEEIFKETIKHGHLENILDEISLQSKVEFNYPEK